MVVVEEEEEEGKQGMKRMVEEVGSEEGGADFASDETSYPR